MDREGERVRFVTEVTPVIQNMLHIPAFAILSILWLSVLKTCQTDRGKRLIFVLLLATAFGIVNELIQMGVPGRYAGTLDLCLNTVGVLTGVLIYSALERGNPGIARGFHL